MEAICSSETSVETQRTTRSHIPEDDNTLVHRLFCYFILSSTDGSLILFCGLSLSKECVLFIDMHQRHSKTKIAVRQQRLAVV
jgi:hypothetical protein